MEIVNTPRGAGKSTLIQSHLELLLAEHIKDRDLPTPIREYLFAWDELDRKWRADFAWPDLMLLVEVEGGTKGKSRHTQSAGYQVDCRKYNDAAFLGYAVLRFTAEMINSFEAVNTIQEFILERYGCMDCGGFKQMR